MTGSALKPSLSARKGHSFCSVSPLKGFYSSTAYPNEVEAFLRTLFPRTAWKSFLQSFPKGITHQLLTEVYTYTYSPNSYKNSEGRHFYSPLCKYRLCFRGLSIPDDNNKSRQAFAITQTPSRHLIYIQFSGHVYHISQVSFTIVWGMKNWCWKKLMGTFLVVQWLRLCSQCRGPGFDPWSRN